LTITLEQLVRQWKGKRATFEVVPSNDESQLRVYEGIIDGPYLGDDGGVGFMLGSRVIHGDIAVEAPFFEFWPSTGRAKHTVAESYVGLRAIELPVVVDIQGDVARWEATGGDQRIARCRLVAA
jgi:hypothetical protein